MTNPLRTDLEVADIHDTGMELDLEELNVIAVDAAVRNHIGFMFRCVPNMEKVGDKEVTFEKNPEYYRFGPDGKPMAASGYSGGRPSLGISHPDIRESRRKVYGTGNQGGRRSARLPALCAVQR